MKKRITVFCSIAASILLLSYGITSHSKASNSTKPSYEHYYNNDDIDHTESVPNNKNNNNNDSSDFVPDHQDSTIDLDPTSATVLINKTYALDKDYVPENLTIPNIKFSFYNYDPKMQLREDAAKAIESMFTAASDDGYILAGVSGYRSYERQFEIYVSNLRKRGVEFTKQYSAMPGTSEHQTGLSMDISTPTINNRLSDTFASTKEGQWVAENCYKYGFIIRYPKDKTHVTGYSYEPWHVRYVGVELATHLFENNLTLDEYYGYEYNEELYDDIDYDAIIDEYNELKGIKKNEVSPSTSFTRNTPTPTPSISLNEESSNDNSENKENTPTPTPTVTAPKEPEPTPTKIPTKQPTKEPTKEPTKQPTKKPTATPTPELEKPTTTPSPEVDPPVDTPTPDIDNDSISDSWNQESDVSTNDPNSPESDN